MPLCSMNSESEPRAASSCGVSVSKRPGLRASAPTGRVCCCSVLAAVPEKPLFLFHFPYRHNLNPHSVSFEGLPLGESDDFPCLQPVTEEAVIKPPISRSTLSSFNVQQTCISSATRSPFSQRSRIPSIHRSRISRPLLQVFSLS